jgi:hypothetical protein
MILVLYALCVVYVYSRYIDYPLIGCWETTPHSWGGSVIVGIRAGLGLNTH